MVTQPSWDAVAAVGQWAGVFATAGAVLYASQHAERAAMIERRGARREKYSSIATIFARAPKLISDTYAAANHRHLYKTGGGPGLQRFDDLLTVLSGVPVLELESGEAAEMLFKIRDRLVQVRPIAEQLLDEKYTGFETRGHGYDTMMAELSFAVSRARKAATTGIWPRFNGEKIELRDEFGSVSSPD